MEIGIRQEGPSDYSIVAEIVRRAFERATHTNGREFLLVGELRRSKDFLPELSLVAESNGKLAGHVLFSKVQIVSGTGEVHNSLALGPVAVTPDLQKLGIGAKLIEHGHQVAKSLGFDSIVLLGHPTYYPRFGYTRASTWGIRPEWDVPDECFMALELHTDSLRGVSGLVKYPSEFSAR